MLDARAPVAPPADAVACSALWRGAGAAAGAAAALLERRRPAGPGGCSRVGALLAVLGWVADTQTSVQSDVTKLVPPSMPALRDLHTLERVTGVSGEIDVTVSGARRRDPDRRRLDDPLRERADDPLRLPRDEGLRALDAVPGAVAAGSVPAGGQSGQSAGPSRVVDPEPARGGPAVLLAGGDHARPSQRDARVRDPPDAAVQAGAGDRLHALAAASAAGGDGAAGRAAGARRRRERGAVVLRAPAADAAGRTDRGRGRCCSRCSARPSARWCRWFRSRSRPAGRR